MKTRSKKRSRLTWLLALAAWCGAAKADAATVSHLNIDVAITANLSVSASVLNIFDRTPPYDPGFDSTNIYDFTQYDVRGRIWRVGASYKFR